MEGNTDWKQAIEQRKSVRAYEPVPLEPYQREKLSRFLAGHAFPFSHQCGIVLFAVPPGAKVFGPLPHPAEGAAFYSAPDAASRTRLGFVGEMFVLYAQSLGVGTCWTGHFSAERLPEEVRSRQNGRSHICCVTPLGTPRQKGPRLTERIGGRLMSGRRKDLSALLSGVPPEPEIAPEILRALGWARRAPSALNGQPWRFFPGADMRSVEIRQDADRTLRVWKYPEVDVGIYACHFWLGLLEEGLTCEVGVEVEGSRACWCFQGIERASDRKPPHPGPVAL